MDLQRRLSNDGRAVGKRVELWSMEARLGGWDGGASGGRSKPTCRGNQVMAGGRSVGGWSIGAMVRGGRAGRT